MNIIKAILMVLRIVVQVTSVLSLILVIVTAIYIHNGYEIDMKYIHDDKED